MINNLIWGIIGLCFIIVFAACVRRVNRVTNNLRHANAELDKLILAEASQYKREIETGKETPDVKTH